ncbi:DUF1634 domain-containing protein [Chlorobaculum sp. MV4-Y]|uniref:DUF1634 domain-containing protein n=1 Tax=Chlorobaculum sp. MV4-Y TaxID=2976335 RepID=UPI0021AF7CEB|nr:DUF1634 domain-containing protein [Chlorobaculum sp. MV4-Y]UWX56944.1 DUF1634 domain-containing protein [Chlorobaculum sp. MV4-Y]
MNAHPKPEMNDLRMKGVIGNLLRVGVLLAASIVLVGGILFLVHHGGELPEYHIFHGSSSPLRTIPGVIHGLMTFQKRAIIQLGLLLLILTPVANVLFTVFAFWEEKDKLYVGVSSLVFLFLLFSLLGGKF